MTIALKQYPIWKARETEITGYHILKVNFTKNNANIAQTIPFPRWSNHVTQIQLVLFLATLIALVISAAIIVRASAFGRDRLQIYSLKKRPRESIMEVTEGPLTDAPWNIDVIIIYFVNGNNLYHIGNNISFLIWSEHETKNCASWYFPQWYHDN